MALAGHAFLALWNDIARAREPEYDQWHTVEHVPERVSVTGFHGARRYVNRSRQFHRYFTLYDVASLAVFESGEYVDLLNHPTPWSASMRPDFSNFLRSICSVIASRGTGIGAALAILCVPPETDDASLRATLDETSPLPRVTAVHLGRTAPVGSAVSFSKPPPESAPLRSFDRIALIETLDRDAAARALAEVKRRLGLDALPADFGADVYDLAFVFPGSDAGERLPHRRPGWDAAAL
ncbi:MAG: hypothetical protein M3023_07730 [Pseudomonadota bacterium]|nr:hypothetical protein [Pseudomonadota bacterium]